MRPHLPLLLSIVLFGVANETLASPKQTEIVALSGMPAPDGNGSFFLFRSPTINNAGEVAFLGVLQETNLGAFDNNGVFVAGNGMIRQSLREGTPLPNAEGMLLSNGFSLFSDPVIDALGEVVIQSPIRKTVRPQEDNSAIVRGGNTIELIATEGQATPSGISQFDRFFDPHGNDLGSTSFVAALRGPETTPENNLGVFQHQGGTLNTVMQRGQAAPEGIGIFHDFDERLAMNNADQVAVLATTTNPVVGYDFEAIYRGNADGSIDAVAVPGQRVGNGAGYLGFVGAPSMNLAGTIAFAGGVIDDLDDPSADQAAFAVGAEGVSLVARNWQPVPNGVGVFGGFFSVSLNDQGQVAFGSLILNTGNAGPSLPFAVFRWEQNQLLELAREGDEVGRAGDFLDDIETFSFNQKGQIVIEATVSGEGKADRDTLYLRDDHLGLVQVVQAGQAFLGSEITSLSFSNDGLNDRGQIAYGFRLADGRSGVALWTPVPEPSSFALCCFVVGLVGSKRPCCRVNGPIDSVKLS